MTETARFAIPEFTDVQCAFGADGSAYLTREQIGDFWDMNNKTPYHKAVSGLFFQGGSLADYGLKWKDDVDAAKAMRALKAMLGSFEPQHEIKENTVAVLLRDNCDLIT